MCVLSRVFRVPKFCISPLSSHSLSTSLVAPRQLCLPNQLPRLPILSVTASTLLLAIDLHVGDVDKRVICKVERDDMMNSTCTRTLFMARIFFLPNYQLMSYFSFLFFYFFCDV